jgi:hypothetical protein
MLANGAGASAQISGETASRSPFSRESIRRAVDTASAIAQAEQADERKRDWQRVRDLRPGSEVYLTVESGSSKCTVLASDDKSLTIVKLNGTLPFAVTEVLRELMSRDPQLVVTAATSGRTDTSRKVKIGPDGIFLADKKIAATSDVIVRVDRADVREVRKRPKGRSVGRTIGGAFLGAGIGAALGSVIDSGANISSVCGGACWGAVAAGTGFAILLGRDTGPIYTR